MGADPTDPPREPVADRREVVAARRRKPGGPRALAPELVPIGDLRPDPANANLHPVKNLDAIKTSLDQFGQVKAIVVSKNLTIVAGNGTYEAALDLGWTALGAIIFPGTVAEARAYAIADNRTAELAEWDRALLLETLNSIEDPDLLAAAGFDADDRELLAKLLDSPSGRHVEFTAHDENIATEHQCPRCGFQWSGDSKPKADA